MPVDEVVLLGALVTTTAIGVGFTFFAYDIAGSLLSWIGWIGGGGIGGAAGWIVVPELLGPGTTTEEVLLYTVGLVIVGAFAGRILIKIIGRFAVMFAGFATAFLSVLVLISGEQMVNDLATLLAEGEMADSAVASSFTADQTVQQALLMAVGAGVIGSLIAWKFYSLIISGAVTAGGAGVLGIVIPAWQRALSDSPEAIDGFAEVSATWVAVTFLAGVVFQAIRHSDRFDEQ